jgi:hypothetical protein
MALKHMPWAHDVEEGFETPTQRYIFLEMVYWSDRRGVLRMSQKELGERVLLSRQSVSREVGKLVRGGFLRRLDHGRYGVIFDDMSAPLPASGANGHEICRFCSKPIGVKAARTGQYITNFLEGGAEYYSHPSCAGY